VALGTTGYIIAISATHRGLCTELHRRRESVGLPVGDTLGLVDGAALGVLGDSLGLALGLALGADVGEALGDVLGDALGDALGNGVCTCGSW
jgi:hypothetical protein